MNWPWHKASTAAFAAIGRMSGIVLVPSGVL